MLARLFYGPVYVSFAPQMGAVLGGFLPERLFGFERVQTL